MTQRKMRCVVLGAHTGKKKPRPDAISSVGAQIVQGLLSYGADSAATLVTSFFHQDLEYRLRSLNTAHAAMRFVFLCFSFVVVFVFPFLLFFWECAASLNATQRARP
eukprot:COSAG05_NODE_1129_length_5779_cov_11.914789_5_plen_107_part_00